MEWTRESLERDEDLLRMIMDASSIPGAWSDLLGRAYDRATKSFPDLPP